MKYHHYTGNTAHTHARAGERGTAQPRSSMKNLHTNTRVFDAVLSAAQYISIVLNSTILWTTTTRPPATRSVCLTISLSLSLSISLSRPLSLCLSVCLSLCECVCLSRSCARELLLRLPACLLLLAGCCCYPLPLVNVTRADVIDSLPWSMTLRARPGNREVANDTIAGGRERDGWVPLGGYIEVSEAVGSAMGFLWGCCGMSGSR